MIWQGQVAAPWLEVLRVGWMGLWPTEVSLPVVGVGMGQGLFQSKSFFGSTNPLKNFWLCWNLLNRVP